MTSRTPNTDKKPNIVIVDKDDNVIGAMPYLEAVKNESIRSIVRIFILNEAGQFLLQQRAGMKWAPYLWDSAAAGHVDEDETPTEAAIRESKEEIGIDLSVGDLEEFNHEYHEVRDVSPEDSSTRMYRAWSRVYVGKHEGPFLLQKSEVEQIKWMEIAEIDKWVKRAPEEFMLHFLSAYEVFRRSKY